MNKSNSKYVWIVYYYDVDDGVVIDKVFKSEHQADKFARENYTDDEGEPIDSTAGNISKCVIE